MTICDRINHYTFLSYNMLQYLLNINNNKRYAMNIQKCKQSLLNFLQI